MKQRIIFHIDMNSYFATAEQQSNPFLRGKPIAIGGSEGSRSVIVAASIEAKKYGVKTAMKHMDARRLCPHLIFIDGDPVKYGQLTQIFFDICKRFTDRLEIYSIDELFMDLTGWIKNHDEAISLSAHLKLLLQREVGDYLTCSVGIAPNRMMAKLASGMKKPDGLTIFKEEDFPQVLKWIEMTDLPGIGPRLKIRLTDMGIRTLEQLGRFPVDELKRLFGPNNGEILSRMGRGLDHTEIPHIDEFEDTKSMGHTYTLGADTYNRDQVYAVLLRLSEKVGVRLRKDQYQGQLVWVWLRWGDFSGRREHQTLKHYIDNGYQIYDIAKEIISHWRFDQPVRAIGVGVGLLIHEAKQLTFDASSQRQERLVLAQDSINNRFGNWTVQRARSMRVSLKKKVGGFKEQGQFQ